jgi:enoyl-CoA hydratase/carnithine racemase
VAEFATLCLETEAGIARIGFENPPLNLFDLEMEAELAEALSEVEADPSVRVLLFESLLPDYFIAHYDVAAILAEDTVVKRTSSGGFNRLMQRIAASPKVTVAKIAGAARGGGIEFLLALDMRFAVRERAVFSFPEVALGILPAGGGTQRLPSLVGRARALELILGAGDLSADLAERYGLVNRALPAAELDDLVAALCDRIAAHPPQAVALAKLAIGVGLGQPTEAGMALEALSLDLLKAEPEVRAVMQQFVEAGGQTADGERNFEALLAEVRVFRKSIERRD